MRMRNLNSSKYNKSYWLGRIGLFLLCGNIYYLIEYIYKHGENTSWTMFILAGCLGLIIYAINNVFSFYLDIRVQVFYATIITTLSEGVAGLIINKWLGLGVWDYSSLPFSFFWGQCNLFFVGAWVIIICFAIPLCDAWNYYICDIEPIPYYRIGYYKFAMPKNKERRMTRQNYKAL